MVIVVLVVVAYKYCLFGKLIIALMISLIYLVIPELHPFESLYTHIMF